LRALRVNQAIREVKRNVAGERGDWIDPRGTQGEHCGIFSLNYVAEMLRNMGEETGTLTATNVKHHLSECEKVSIHKEVGQLMVTHSLNNIEKQQTLCRRERITKYIGEGLRPKRERRHAAGYGGKANL